MKPNKKKTIKIIQAPYPTFSMFICICVIVCVICISGCDPQENSTPTTATHKTKKTPEAVYQKQWCNTHAGEREVVLKDRTRCDCLTRDYAVEVDFSKKWAEAIGQSLHYARLTGKKAGILLIVNGKKDNRHLRRLKANIAYYRLPIRVWRITAKDLDTGGKNTK